MNQEELAKRIKRTTKTALKQHIMDLGEKLAYLERKVAHGCADAPCDLCEEAHRKDWPCCRVIYCPQEPNAKTAIIRLSFKKIKFNGRTGSEHYCTDLDEIIDYLHSKDILPPEDLPPPNAQKLLELIQAGYLRHHTPSSWKKAIFSDPRLAYNYVCEVIEGRWPEAEKTISKDPEYAYLYASEIIRGRWPEAEKTIAQDPEHAYHYARDIIEGRWPEAEKTISKDPEYAYLYACEVIKGRWPEAEKTIRRVFWVFALYDEHVIKGRKHESIFGS